MQSLGIFFTNTIRQIQRNPLKVLLTVAVPGSGRPLAHQSDFVMHIYVDLLLTIARNVPYGVNQQRLWITICLILGDSTINS